MGYTRIKPVFILLKLSQLLVWFIILRLYISSIKSEAISNNEQQVLRWMAVDPNMVKPTSTPQFWSCMGYHDSTREMKTVKVRQVVR